MHFLGTEIYNSRKILTIPSLAHQLKGKFLLYCCSLVTRLGCRDRTGKICFVYWLRSTCSFYLSYRYFKKSPLGTSWTTNFHIFKNTIIYELHHKDISPDTQNHASVTQSTKIRLKGQWSLPCTKCMHLNKNFKAIMHDLFGEVHSKGYTEQNSLSLVLITGFFAGKGHFSSQMLHTCMKIQYNKYLNTLANIPNCTHGFECSVLCWVRIQL